LRHIPVNVLMHLMERAV